MARPCRTRKPSRSVKSTPASVATPSNAADASARARVRPPAIIMLEIVTPSGSLCRKIAMKTMNPSSGRTRNALAAATRAYSRALDTGEQVLLRVAGGILEHFLEQARQRCSHFGTGSHSGGDEVVATDGEILQVERRVLGADRSDGFQERGAVRR